MAKRKGATTIVSRSTARPKREPTVRRARSSRDGSHVEAPPRPVVSQNARNPLDHCRALIRDVPDFPTPGILFKDITPLLADPRAFHIVLDSLAERFIGEHVDAIVGIEARGFIFGGALAARLNASFVPARKPGKLPSLSDRVSFSTEYSRTELEMHKDSLVEESRVLIVDDVLATGGTARAAADLVRRRERLLPVRVESVLTY